MFSVFQSSEMQFDRSGSRHLMCVESKAIDLVPARLETAKYAFEKLKILHWSLKNVASTLDIERFESIKDLELRLVKIHDRAFMGMRFYAIGSEQFVDNLTRYARSFGLSDEKISIEVVSKETKNVYCSNCMTINSSVLDNIFICSNCGIKSVLDNYYSSAEKAEQDRILTCVSRAKSNQIVIDL